jgi:hypothetical protein
MCVGGGKTPKAPDLPPPPPAVPQAAVPVSHEETGSRDQDRRRKAGRSGTILTGNQGLTGEANTGKTVLGG